MCWYPCDATLGTVHDGPQTAAHFGTGVSRTQDNLKEEDCCRCCCQPKQLLRRHLHPRTRTICLLNHMIVGIPGRLVPFMSRRCGYSRGSVPEMPPNRILRINSRKGTPKHTVWHSTTSHSLTFTHTEE